MSATSRAWAGLSLALSAGGYLSLGYKIPREAVFLLTSVYFFLFANYLFLLRSARNNHGFIKPLLIASIVFRGIFLFSTPALSDDFYRFIWDGLLANMGINPFRHLPAELVNQLNHPLAKTIYENLNSKDYYTVYPPVLQGVFRFATFLFPDNLTGALMVMRSIVLIAEVASIYLLYRLPDMLEKPVRYALIYALNPLVIIELTGNLHFEALAVFFTLLMVYLVYRKKELFAGISLAMATGVKLLPMLWLPFAVFSFIKHRFRFVLVYGITVAGIFYPLFAADNAFGHFLQSLKLYFNHFEFNASIYYIAKAIFQESDKNVIALMLSVVFVLAMLFMILIFYYKGSAKNLVEYMLLTLTVYFFLSTTVHPWYITPLIALSALTNHRFPLLWSGLIFLTYTAYDTLPYKEHEAVIALEYIPVMCLLLKETLFKGNDKRVKKILG